MKNTANNLKVSLLVPLHNSEQFFDNSIKRILEQTYENLEIIFHDDASSDKTKEKILQIAKENPKVKVIWSNTNIGLGPSRDKLLEAASGDYIFFIDCDDYFVSKNVIKKIVEKIPEGTEIASTKFKIKFESGLKTIINNPVISLKINPNAIEYYMDSMTFAWGHFINLEYLRRLNIKFGEVKSYEDIAQMGKIFVCCKKFKKLRGFSIIYRRFKDSLSSFSSNFKEKFFSFNTSYKLNMEKIDKFILPEYKEKYYSKLKQKIFLEHLNLISSYYLSLKSNKTKKEFKKFIQEIYPDILKIYGNPKIKNLSIIHMPIILTKFLYKQSSKSENLLAKEQKRN